MKAIAILGKNGKEQEKLDLPQDIFEGHVNVSLLHQALLKYQAALRQGTVQTKERAYVSGGGKKPFRQKGTGRARAGSNRSPLWKGGGTIFGPHPRDFSFELPKKIRRIALRESLKAKIKDEKMICVEEWKEKFLKTKDFAKILKELNVQGKTLFLLDGCDDSVRLVSRNIPRLSLMRSFDVSAYDVLKNQTLLLTKSAFTALIKRIQS